MDEQRSGIFIDAAGILWNKDADYDKEIVLRQDAVQLLASLAESEDKVMTQSAHGVCLDMLARGKMKSSAQMMNIGWAFMTRVHRNMQANFDLVFRPMAVWKP